MISNLHSSNVNYLGFGKERVRSQRLHGTLGLDTTLGYLATVGILSLCAILALGKTIPIYDVTYLGSLTRIVQMIPLSLASATIVACALTLLFFLRKRHQNLLNQSRLPFSNEIPRAGGPTRPLPLLNSPKFDLSKLKPEGPVQDYLSSFGKMLADQEVLGNNICLVESGESFNRQDFILTHHLNFSNVTSWLNLGCDVLCLTPHIPGLLCHKFHDSQCVATSDQLILDNTVYNSCASIRVGYYFLVSSSPQWPDLYIYANIVSQYGGYALYAFQIIQHDQHAPIPTPFPQAFVPRELTLSVGDKEFLICDGRDNRSSTIVSPNTANLIELMITPVGSFPRILLSNLSRCLAKLDNVDFDEFIVLAASVRSCVASLDDNDFHDYLKPLYRYIFADKTNSLVSQTMNKTDVAIRTAYHFFSTPGVTILQSFHTIKALFEEHLLSSLFLILTFILSISLTFYLQPLHDSNPFVGSVTAPAPSLNPFREHTELVEPYSIVWVWLAFASPIVLTPVIEEFLLALLSKYSFWWTNMIWFALHGWRGLRGFIILWLTLVRRLLFPTPSKLRWFFYLNFMVVIHMIWNFLACVHFEPAGRQFLKCISTTYIQAWRHVKGMQNNGIEVTTEMLWEEFCQASYTLFLQLKSIGNTCFVSFPAASLDVASLILLSYLTWVVCRVLNRRAKRYRTLCVSTKRPSAKCRDTCGKVLLQMKLREHTCHSSEFCQIGPALPFHLPLLYSPCTCNLSEAITHRVLVEQMPFSVPYRKIERCFKALKRTLDPTPLVWDAEGFVLGKPKPVRDRFWKGVHSLEKIGCPLVQGMTDVQIPSQIQKTGNLFVKREFYDQNPYMDFKLKRPRPRTIVGCSDEILALLGPFMHSLDLKVKKISGIVKHKAAFQLDITRIEEAAADWNTEPFSSDVSSFDAAQRSEALLIQHQLFYLLGLPACIVDFLDVYDLKFSASHYDYVGGKRTRTIKFKSSDGTRKSGDPHTSVGNNLYHWFIMMYHLWSNGLSFSDCEICINGDDFFGVMKHQTPLSVQTTFSQFGIELKIGPTYEFCGGMFMGQRKQFVRDPARALFKFGFTHNSMFFQPSESKSQLRSIALCQTYLASANPIFSALVQRCLELTNGVERAEIDVRKLNYSLSEAAIDVSVGNPEFTTDVPWDVRCDYYRHFGIPPGLQIHFEEMISKLDRLDDMPLLLGRLL